MAELLIAVNPDEDSRLPLLLRVPLGGGDLLFRTSGTWPREKALFAYPVPLDEWPDDPVIVERVRLRSCRRRGAAIDVIADRSRTTAPSSCSPRLGPRRGVLAVAAHPQTGTPERAHPDRPRARHRGAADRGRQPRAVRLPVRNPAGHHGQAGAAVRGLRNRR
ncbi:putative eRCC4 domain protein [Mycobacterium xenopi 4042]|uniref:Putative eRCC4 domain protein n=1 Tax=Mycobacterium xenopi 4042 TaxID=1299334 RepID=X7Z3Q1_MYCXE|nr:putative eRCC4 domain protein [Mycobacterium xenopi 4042]